MTQKPSDRQTLGELNSALLLVNEQNVSSLQLVGWVAHPRASAVLLEVGLTPSDIYLSSPEARPDVARLLPHLDPERIFGFRAIIPVPKSQKFSALLHVYGVITLSNGEQEAISFAVSRPREVRVAAPETNLIESAGASASLTELLRHQKRFTPQAPSLSARSDAPDLSVIVHGQVEPSYLHSQLESLRKLLPQASAELLHAESDSAPQPVLSFSSGAEAETQASSLANMLNRSVSRARGKYLLFISSHSLLQTPALQRTLSIVQADANLGVLGGAIYSPAGGLIECGASVNRRTLVFEPNTADVAATPYRSPAEFISKHFLLTPKSVFLSLGGFEDSAYFDADYCFRARERSLQVFVDPSIVHISAESETAWFAAANSEQTKLDAARFAARHFTARSSAARSTAMPPLFLFSSPESLGLADRERLYRIAREAIALGFLPTLVSFAREKEFVDELFREAPPSLGTLQLRRPKELRDFLASHASRDFISWLTPGPAVRLFLAGIDWGKRLTPASSVILDLRGTVLDVRFDAECATPYFLEGRLGVPTDCAESLLQLADVIVSDNAQTAEILGAAGFDSQRLLVDASSQGDPKATAASLAFAAAPKRHPVRFPALRQIDPAHGEKSRNYSMAVKSTIDVVVPVFNAFELTRSCISRVLQNTDRPFRLIVVDDASNDPRLAEYLESLKFIEHPPQLVDLQVLRNDRNLGFVRSVNRGIAASRNHAVILNSDTEVPPGWLSRLTAPVESFPLIASVTPFSNCATICSFPTLSKSAPIPPGITGDEIDECCRQLQESAPIEIPTGVGFCMLLNRAAIDAVGLFDPVLFGRGYGEENDWCMRAAERGFRHVLNPSLFVAHHEGSSFSVLKDRAAHILSHVERVEAVWPEYQSEVARFEQADPIQETRNRLARSILRARGPKKGTLYISHIGLGGGSAKYLEHRLRRLANAERQFVLQIDSERAMLVACGEILPCEQYVDLNLVNSEWFNQLLAELGVDEVFVNQLVSLETILIADLLLKSTVPFTFFVHDYYAACPSVNLLNTRGEYCKNETRLDACRSCQARGFMRPDVVPDEIAFHDLADWRDRFSRVLSRAARVVAPSASAAGVIQTYYPDVRVEVETHRPQFPLARTFQPAFADLPRLRVSVVGAIAANKGADQIAELVRLIRREKLPIDLTIIGYTNLEADQLPGVTVTGKYEPSEISQLLAEQQTALVLIPSIWPETFSYTTQEALGSGYPVLCFDMGGAAEQVRRSRGGWIADGCSPAALLRELRRISTQRDEIISRAQLLTAWSMLEPAEEELNLQATV